MKKRKKIPLYAVVIIDIVLACVLLCTYAFLNHVVPMIRIRAQSEAVAAEPAPPPEPALTPEPVVVEPEEILEPEPDNRTEWQIKFADKFTDEVVITENSYSSPNVSITINKHEGWWKDNKRWAIVYYVADIYIGSVDCFRTMTAYDEMAYCKTQLMSEMDVAAGALLSINGDFFAYQRSGYMVRNGEVYVSSHNYNDICVLYYDGEMETLDYCTYKVAEVADRGAFQVWSFGPALLDAQGKAKTYMPRDEAFDLPNPRTGIGYFEPGHYCFVVVDGRNNAVTRGLTLPMFAVIFEDLGCKCAYNLDGGGSSMMYFNHECISVPSNGDRKLSDILCITEPVEEQ